MSFNRAKAFENEDGIIFNDSMHAVGGADVPSTAFPAPSGPTVYFQENGAIWLWESSAWRLIKASQLVFDNSSNGFTANLVQTAVEEAKATAVGLPRFTIVTTFNGTIGNNQWLGYSNLIPGDAIPIIIPIKCILKEITYSFSGVSVDGVFDLYKNGTSAGNIQFTETFTNVDNFKVSSSVNVNFIAGDQLRGRWVDTGTNPSDMVIVYVFQADL